MATDELRVRVQGDTIVFDVRGHVDVEAARHLLELAGAAAGRCRAVEIDLGNFDSLSEEAAALLLFGQGAGRRLPEGVTLRTEGRRGRQAVLGAYARHRAGVPGTA